MHPNIDERLAQSHRMDLVRSAEAWRLAHPTEIPAPKRMRSWMLALPWHRAPAGRSHALLAVDPARCECNQGCRGCA